MLRKAVSLPTFLCVILAILVFFPGKREVGGPAAFLAVIFCMEGIYLFSAFRGKNAEAARDIVSLLYGLLILWEIATAKLGIAHQVLVPAPEDVFWVFVTQREMMARGIFSSLALLGSGMAIGLGAGMAFGMVAGWIPRLRNMFFPIARVISPIPPIIYTPYVVALMPTFRSASRLVIILGIFWPTFMNTVLRVTGMEKRLLDSARALCPDTKTMVLSILFPYVWPGIIRNLRVMLSTSFLILTMAEMMGASSGLGYFIKNYSDYANYTNVAAGIILVGIVVSVLNVLIGWMEKHLIKWKN